MMTPQQIAELAQDCGVTGTPEALAQFAQAVNNPATGEALYDIYAAAMVSGKTWGDLTSDERHAWGYVADEHREFTPIRERDNVLPLDGWQYPFESHTNPDVSRCYVDGDKAEGVVHIDGTLDADSLERLAAYLRSA